LCCVSHLFACTIFVLYEPSVCLHFFVVCELVVCLHFFCGVWAVCLPALFCVLCEPSVCLHFALRCSCLIDRVFATLCVRPIWHKSRAVGTLQISASHQVCVSKAVFGSDWLGYRLMDVLGIRTLGKPPVSGWRCSEECVGKDCLCI